MIDPAEVVKKVIEEFGGSDKLFSAINHEIALFNEVWEHDSEPIGRILRSHLAVEHFLTEYLQSANPSLGSLDDARIGFYQKICLIRVEDISISFLIPGLKKLNNIRNRISHNLSIELNDSDSNEFLSIELYKAMRDYRFVEAGIIPSDVPLLVLEDFSRFACLVLQAGASPISDTWKKVLNKIGQSDLT